jgi:predicted transcriptional regulator
VTPPKAAGGRTRGEAIRDRHLIRQAVRQAGLTVPVDTLALKLGVSRATIYKYRERVKASPADPTMREPDTYTLTRCPVCHGRQHAEAPHVH